MKNISIKTVKSGYELKVDEESFFYFNIDALMEGFMYHVGLDENQAATKDKIHSFVNAAKDWRSNNGKSIKELMKLKEENVSLKTKIENYKKRVKTLQTYNKNHGIVTEDANDDVDID